LITCDEKGELDMSKLVKNPESVSLGIIGMSEGNGHPYSWSAIFNGYDRNEMERECPYACIPEYLNQAPECLSQAQVATSPSK
jgi:hypothetical protein